MKIDAAFPSFLRFVVGGCLCSNCWLHEGASFETIWEGISSFTLRSHAGALVSSGPLWLPIIRLYRENTTRERVGAAANRAGKVSSLEMSCLSPRVVVHVDSNSLHACVF